MNKFEREETEALFDAIWSRNMRIDIQAHFYDWDIDEDKDVSIDMPRLNRDSVLLKRICSEVIYNRGAMLIRFYARRGMFEIAGINAVNGTGEWSCMSEYELRDNLDIAKNEVPVVLDHGKRECSHFIYSPNLTEEL